MKTFNSYFKKDYREQLENWQTKVLARSSTNWQVEFIDSALGKVQVLSSEAKTDLPALLILPGFRTSSLIWDLADAMKIYKGQYRIFMLDIPGQPTLSSGLSPKVKGLDYGHWLLEVLEILGLAKVSVIGASFGGELIVKLARVAADRIEAAFLCNPGGLVGISLNFAALYDNVLAMLFPSDQNIKRMIQKIALGSNHSLDEEGMQLLFEYSKIAVKGFVNKAQYPYKMSDAELGKLSIATYLLLGTEDRMFAHHKQAMRAEKSLTHLKEIKLFEGVGHGIELEPSMHQYILTQLKLFKS
jgi:pimeloyl-ACP methyl ester carboxylesterase